MLYKAELHVHIEGSITPYLAKRIAYKNRIALPDDISKNDQIYCWSSFSDFLRVYDLASYILRSAEDYRDLVYDYLSNSAKVGSIYVEMLFSPDHAQMCGLSYAEALSGIAQGIDDAHRDFDIEARIQVMCVRDFGVDSCLRIANQAVKYHHPYVVGFTMGGDEKKYPPHLYAKAYQIAYDAGLGCSIHAGETAGAQSVQEAIDFLPLKRIGHGVRAIEDKNVIQQIIDNNITLEICLSSNIALSIYSNYEDHPLPKLMQQGVLFTLNTDDPPYFNTTIAHEYEIAREYYQFDDHYLGQITRQAILSSFAEDELKQRLLMRLEN